MLWILLFVLILVRMGDAHVHLCFDGQEPPRALHIADDRGSHTHEGEPDHVCADVSAMDAALAKKSAASDDALPIRLTAAAWLLLPPEVRIEAPPVIQNPLPPQPFLSLPPSRGPPV
jgi:hypothetical protein